jgi:hypothetical protein
LTDGSTPGTRRFLKKSSPTLQGRLPHRFPGAEENGRRRTVSERKSTSRPEMAADFLLD